MDFNQRDYFFQMQQMRQLQQMPYSYMYPYPELPANQGFFVNGFAAQGSSMNELESERDLQYLQQMYPADAKRMQKKVEEACDRLDYEGSMMYDEYPDRVSMLLICDRIAQQLQQEDAEKQAVAEAEEALPEQSEQTEDMYATQMRRPGPPPPPPPPFDPGRRNLLEVLLYNEMHKRRCKRRQCRRFW